MIRKVNGAVPKNKPFNYHVQAIQKNLPNNLPKISEECEITSSVLECENEGCTEKKAEKHPEICPFRKVSCVLQNCDRKGPLNGILKHVLNHCTICF